MGSAQSVCKVESESYGSVNRIGDSVSTALSHSIGQIQGELSRQTRSYKALAGLSYEDFLRNVEELNQISGHFLDANGKRLVFAVKKGTDTTALWKGTVRVACVKVDADTKEVESHRFLNLKQFLAVHRSIQAQASVVELADSGETLSVSSSSPSPSHSAAEADGKKTDHPLSLPSFSHSFLLSEALEGTSLEECCVCLERKPDTILPCAHSYCTQCINQWNVNHKTCPVCREKVESADEGWVISDGPDSLDIATEIQKTLMELAQE